MDNTELRNYGDVHRPYSSRFRPELDFAEELVEELTKWYHQLVGVLRWSIELGGVGLLIEVIFLYQHFFYPSEAERHLDAVYRIFRYLPKKWVRNQVGWHMNPFMNRQMIMCLWLL